MLLTAKRIHDGYRFLPEGSVLEADERGTIIAVHGSAPDAGEVFVHEGVLCPGFINVHCHLELSHLKGMLPERTGLIPFLQKVPSYRLAFSDEQKKVARHDAYAELLCNGVVAVGDIANVDDTLDLRQIDKLHIHTFIESIGFTESHAAARFEAALKIYQAFESFSSGGSLARQSIVPHAPYSVAQALFQLIDGHHKESIISIHNQESAAEDEYYSRKTGAVKDLLGGFGIDDSFFIPSGKSSLQTYLPWFSSSHRFIFIHNTWSTTGDIAFGQGYAPEISWCFCPNANLYIENKLPDIPAFIDKGARICIGTDSLASNHQLCIASELCTIKVHFPEIDWEVLLRWATINGAAALQMDGMIGSFEVGKRPGILQLKGLEDLTNKPIVTRIL